MKPPRKYTSAVAFRVALEDRLKKQAQEENINLQRLQRQVAFDRLLCRLFAAPDAPWLLKGGYAMELRVRMARATLDIDLALRRLPQPSADWDTNVVSVLAQLRDLGEMAMPDYFTFLFSDATQDLDAAPYGGSRFSVDARLAERTFVKFHLDVSTGDVLREPYESLPGRDWLAFAGIATTNFPAISPEEQFAEKIHAYTLPRVGRENTRVKDLVDLILLIEQTKLDTALLPKAIRETFQRRKSHDIPTALPPPPASWLTRFTAMAQECSLEPDIKKHFGVVGQFYDKLNL